MRWRFGVPAVEKSLEVFVELLFPSFKLLGVVGLDRVPSHFGTPEEAVPAVVEQGLAVVVPAGVHQPLRAIKKTVACQVGDVLHIAVGVGNHIAAVAQRRRHPEGRAVLLERLDEVVVALQWFVGPHDVGHVFGQLAHHLGVLGHDVAPHHWCRGLRSCRNGFLQHLVAAIDEVHIDLVGTLPVHQLLGAPGAELLCLITVDDEEGRGGYAVIGGLDALAQEVVDLGVVGVEVGTAVHQLFVEGYAQRLFCMGEELQVDHLVGMRRAVGKVGWSQVGKIALVEGVLCVVVAEIVLQGVQRGPLLLAVGGVRHGSAALVVHPSAQFVGGPIENGAAWHRVVKLFQLIQCHVGVMQPCRSFILDGYLLGLDSNAIGLAPVAVKMGLTLTTPPFYTQLSYFCFV